MPSIKFSDSELGFLRSHYEQELMDAELYVAEIRRILSKMGKTETEKPAETTGRKRRGRPAKKTVEAPAEKPVEKKKAPKKRGRKAKKTSTPVVKKVVKKAAPKKKAVKKVVRKAVKKAEPVAPAAPPAQE